MLPLIVLFCSLISLNLSFIVITAPHTTTSCSLCPDVDVSLTPGDCVHVSTGARVKSQNGGNLSPVRFGLKQNADSTFSMLCDCSKTGFSNLVGKFEGNKTLSAELYYFPYNNCQLVGRSPVNYTCTATNTDSCSTPQQRVVVSIDTSQRYTKCDITKCLVDHGYTPAKGNISCSYLNAYWKCAVLTRCADNPEDIRICESLKKTLCPALNCPKSPQYNCTQTPKRVPYGHWNCSADGQNCDIQCAPGFKPNWIYGITQHAAWCNHTAGNWQWLVNRTHPCVRTNCGDLIDKCYKSSTGTPNSCHGVQAYFSCAQQTDCANWPEAQLLCATWQAVCPSLDCTTHTRLMCPNTPELVSTGHWVCEKRLDRDYCQIECNSGYYVAWKPGVSQDYAATCNHTTGSWMWALREQEPCAPILPQACSAEGAYHFSKCENWFNSHYDDEWTFCVAKLAYSNESKYLDYTTCAERYSDCINEASSALGPSHWPQSCTDDASDICCGWKDVDHKVKCSITNAKSTCSTPCVGHPTGVLFGEWYNCNATSCSLKCNNGYYVNYQPGYSVAYSLPPPASCGPNGQWLLNVVNGDSCSSIFPPFSTCNVSSIVNCVKEEENWEECLEYWGTMQTPKLCGCSKALFKCIQESQLPSCHGYMFRSKCQFIQDTYCADYFELDCADV